MPTIDLSSVTELKPVPDGIYVASIVSAQPGVSQKGNEKMDIRWKIEGGEYDGRMIFDTLTFTPEAMWRVKAFLVALDFPADFKGDLQSEDLIGQTAAITVTTERSTGVDDSGEPYPERNRVKRVKQLSGDDKMAAFMGH